ncbi:MAG: protein-export protein SecB [Candidatus Pelagibacter sp. TMED118]|nr:MAG: protein-export protein SecB [Candidatus Pelagibacter sp. TMED118]|tara:strand:+ start:9687 stop:10124 length:438 start_codon:yes stop_codon:yes gene_type:complete
MKKNESEKKYKIMLNFIKDLSIETPNAETLIFVRDHISSYNLGIDINSKPLKNKMIEVSTKLTFRDKNNNDKKSVFELDYATVIKINNDIKEKKQLEKILLCDLQKEIYPKIENIFVNLLNDSGFSGIKFDKKVDFEKLFNERLN